MPCGQEQQKIEDALTRKRRVTSNLVGERGQWFNDLIDLCRAVLLLAAPRLQDLERFPLPPWHAACRYSSTKTHERTHARHTTTIRRNEKKGRGPLQSNGNQSNSYPTPQSAGELETSCCHPWGKQKAGHMNTLESGMKTS